MTTSELMVWVRKNPMPVACGALSLVLAVAIYLRSDAIGHASETLDQKTAEGQRYALNLANAAQLKEQFAALSAANKAIESRLIHASDLGINQQYFFKLEADSGAKLIDVRQSDRPSATAQKGYVSISFAVTLQGNFGQIVTFLRKLEDRTHYCRIQTATCSGNRTGPLTFTASLDLLGTP